MKKDLHNDPAAIFAIDKHFYKNIVTEDVELHSGSSEDNHEQMIFELPFSVYEKLYDYQRDCIRWLWGLHLMKAGGILGVCFASTYQRIDTQCRRECNVWH